MWNRTFHRTSKVAHAWKVNGHVRVINWTRQAQSPTIQFKKKVLNWTKFDPQTSLNKRLFKISFFFKLEHTSNLNINCLTSSSFSQSLPLFLLWFNQAESSIRWLKLDLTTLERVKLEFDLANSLSWWYLNSRLSLRQI